MKTFNRFIPLLKVDEAKREVYGTATAELEDKSGEVFDYDSSLPYYKEWSGEIAKASGGKSLGNVREMHTNIAAGKLTQIEFNDAEKRIEICAKIVNDSTWEKVMEGVLTGFSHGGEYIKTWKDPDNAKVTRYTARPSEISVVDNPCLGAATFQLVRADGATEMRKFKNKETPMTTTVDNAAPTQVAPGDGKPAQPKHKPVQKWEASDGKTFEKKEEWRMYELELEKTAAVRPVIEPALNALAELEKAVSEKEGNGDLTKVFNDAIQVAKHISLDPAYASIASNTKQRSNLEGGVVVVNMKRFPGSTTAQKALAPLLLEKSVVVLDSDAVFPAESPISLNADFFGITAPAIRVLLRASNATGPTLRSSGLSTLSKQELAKRLNNPTDTANSISFIVDANATEDSLELIDIPMLEKAIIMEGAKASTFDPHTAFTAIGTAFDIGKAIHKRDFTDKERKRLAESGAAMEDGSFPIESVQDLKNAIHAYGRAADKDKAKAHIIARAKALGEEKMLPEGWGGNENKDDNGAEKAVMPTLKKGMGEVARTANMIQEMNWLADCLTWEAASEGDNSPQPNRFKQIITEMCSFLEALVEEECRELATPHAVELMGAETMEMAAGMSDDLRKNVLGRMLKASGGDTNIVLKLNSIFNQSLAKAGARHSAADKAQLTKAMSSLDDASDNLDGAKKAHGVVGKAHDGMRKCMGAMQDCMKSLKSGDLSKLDAEALEKYRKEADENSGKMADHMDEMETQLDKADKHQGKMAKSHDGIEAAHDAAHHALKAVGAMEADDAAEKATQATLAKATDELTLVKADLTAKDSDLTATRTENAELKKALDTINGQVPALIERIKKLEAQPMPPKGAVFSVTKGHEAATEPAKPVEAPSYSTYGASPAEMRELMNIHP